MKDYYIFGIGKSRITKNISGLAHASFYGRDSYVNMLFIAKNTFKKKLLFDKDLLIVHHKLANFNNRDGHYCSKNIFQVIKEDTNNNNKYDEEDRHDLYVSNYNGSEVRELIKDIDSWEIDE